jgi:hypothetical protein
VELQVACDDHSTLARWVTDPHCPRRPALGPSRYSACHQRQSRNARKARSRRRGPSLTERFRRPRRRCRTNDQVVAKAQPLANRCRDAHLANRRCAAARGARPAFVLAGHEGHDVVAACVRERQRSTAALASTSWLLRSLSGDGVDGERVIATVAKRKPGSSVSGDQSDRQLAAGACRPRDACKRFGRTRIWRFARPAHRRALRPAFAMRRASGLDDAQHSTGSWLGLLLLVRNRERVPTRS